MAHIIWGISDNTVPRDKSIKHSTEPDQTHYGTGYHDAVLPGTPYIVGEKMKIFKIISRSTKAENVCGLYYGLHKFCSFGSKRFWFDLLLNQKFKKQQDLKKMSKNCNL